LDEVQKESILWSCKGSGSPTWGGAKVLHLTKSISEKDGRVLSLSLTIMKVLIPFLRKSLESFKYDGPE